MRPCRLPKDFRVTHRVIITVMIFLIRSSIIIFVVQIGNPCQIMSVLFFFLLLIYLIIHLFLKIYYYYYYSGKTGKAEEMNEGEQATIK